MRVYKGIIVLFLLASTLSAQTLIAVVDFSADGVTPNEARILTERLRHELSNSEQFKLIERGMMLDILKEQEIQQSGCVTTECIVEVGKLVGVNKIIGGSIGRFGTIYTVAARIVDVETGEVLKSTKFDNHRNINYLLTEGMAEIANSLCEKQTPSSISKSRSLDIPLEKEITETSTQQNRNNLFEKKPPEVIEKLTIPLPNHGLQLVNAAKENIQRGNNSRVFEIYLELTNTYIVNDGMDGWYQFIDKAHYWLASYYLNINEYELAYNQYKSIIVSYPQSPYLSQALYYSGLIHAEHLKNFQVAIAFFQHFLLEYPADPLASATQYKIALIADNELEDWVQAVEEYQTFADTYPDKPEAIVSLMRLGEIQASKLNQLEKAVSTYHYAAQLYSKLPQAVEALERCGNLYESEKKYVEAIVEYLSISQTYPGSDRALPTLEKCANIYSKRLKDNAKLKEVLTIIVEKYPESKNAKSASKKLSKL